MRSIVVIFALTVALGACAGHSATNPYVQHPIPAMSHVTVQYVSAAARAQMDATARQLEVGLAPGTRIYQTGDYIITDGNHVYDVPAFFQLGQDASGVHVTNPKNGSVFTVSSTSTVRLVLRSRRYYFAPGKPIPAFLGSSIMSARDAQQVAVRQQMQSVALSRYPLVSLPRSLDPTAQLHSLPHGTEVFKVPSQALIPPGTIVRESWSLVFIYPGQRRPVNIANRQPDYIVP